MTPTICLIIAKEAILASRSNHSDSCSINLTEINPNNTDNIATNEFIHFFPFFADKYPTNTSLPFLVLNNKEIC
jgi:hypothetical protein